MWDWLTRADISSFRNSSRSQLVLEIYRRGGVNKPTCPRRHVIFEELVTKYTHLFTFIHVYISEYTHVQAWDKRPPWCWRDWVSFPLSSTTSSSWTPYFHSIFSHIYVQEIYNNAYVSSVYLKGAVAWDFSLIEPMWIPAELYLRFVEFSSEFAKMYLRLGTYRRYLGPHWCTVLSDLSETMSELSNISRHQRCLRFRWCRISGASDTAKKIGWRL